jgi:NADPH:quinone reductase-like Zn-dependent oxidoreductase
MMKGRYPVPVIDRGVPTSDCGAEVVAIGASVTSCKVGDHVAPSYDLLNGLYGDGGEMALLGGDVDGLLREYAIYEEHTLYHLPKHLSWEEVSSYDDQLGTRDRGADILFFFCTSYRPPLLLAQEPRPGMH